MDVKKVNYWLISDTHFNHEKIEEWGGRSGDWQKQIWDGISSIPKGDVLIHLGDICIGGDELICRGLFTEAPVSLVLIRGNHDKKSLSWYNEYFDVVCDGMELLYEGRYLYLSHRPQPQFGHITHNIHGHTHGNMHRSEEYVEWYDKSYHIDISPELVGFKPLRLDTLLKKLPSNQ